MRKPAVNIAVQAARRAGTVIQRSIHRADAIGVSDKGQYDFVTDADKLAEAEIIKEIRKAYPDHAIWGEETGRSGNSRYVWVIDPIDGTSNFMRGFPLRVGGTKSRRKAALRAVRRRPPNSGRPQFAAAGRARDPACGCRSG